jgi:hypothetical protein
VDDYLRTIAIGLLASVHEVMPTDKSKLSQNRPSIMSLMRSLNETFDFKAGYCNANSSKRGAISCYSFNLSTSPQLSENLMCDLNIRQLMLTHPLDCLEPSDQPLLDLIFDRVDDSMLAEIAMCDYGHDVEIHLTALHQIRANKIPIPLQWHPGEVLELTRWTEWDSLSPQDGDISTRNHWMRLFACAVLIWASLEPENYEDPDGGWNHIEGESSTIIQLIDSARQLGDDVSTATVRFLGWRMQCQIKRALIHEDFGNCPCYAVAMLLLCVSLNRCNPEIASFLIVIAHCNDEGFSISREIDECQRSQKWRDLIDRILLAPTASDYARTYPALQSLAREMIGATATHEMLSTGKLSG